MYNNIGSKVKGLAIFGLIIGILGSLAGAIVMWAVGLTGAGFGTLIGGCLSAWIGSWVIYCIGDTNVKTTEMQEIIAGLDRKANKQAKETAKLKETVVQKDEAQQTEQKPIQPMIRKKVIGGMEIPEYATAIRIAEDKEQCTFCGEMQKAGRSVCWNCGVKFKREA